MVADAVAAVAGDFEDHFFGGDVDFAATEFEAGESVEEFFRVAVVEEEALVFSEFGVECDAEEAVFAGPG